MWGRAEPSPEISRSQLRLDSEAAVMRGGLSGPVLVPGNGEASPLVRRLLGVDEPPMPMGGEPLSAEQIAKVRAWIDSFEPSAPVRPASTHWAYVSPVEPELPTVENSGWPRNPIDAFVLAALEKKELGPSPEARKEALIRRLSLDLIGLPPSLEEVDAFVADARPDAYDALVDRLLSSPRYGERWARPWLDLARYADTHGYEKDGQRSIWKYRDWVIDALNSGYVVPPVHHRANRRRHARGRDARAKGRDGVSPQHTLESRRRCRRRGSTVGDARRPGQHDGDRVARFDTRLCAVPQPQIRSVQPAGTELESLQLELDTPTTALTADQSQWEAALRRADADWTTLRPLEIRSRGGAELTVLDDGSILASGENPEADTYEIEAAPDSTNIIISIRLEVLEHPSLPNGGPGRDADGNFFLSDFEIEIAGTRVELDDAVANDFQRGYDVARALSSRPGSGGWALDGSPSRPGLPRQAVFVPSEAFTAARLTIRLKHNMRRAARNLGRFRLSTTSIEKPLRIVRLPARLYPVLDIAVSDRTEEQATAVAAVHRSNASLLDPVREGVGELEQALDALAIPTTLVLQERDSHARPSTPMRIRGSFMSPGELVYADVPSALPELPAEQMPNRLGLAHWLVDSENPLTARVTVNRLWEQIFGRGLVETSEDFGSQGSPPSHPELLDWLATRFMADGWSQKAMIRTIVTSATYRQSSAALSELWELDPYNRLLARGPRFRVEAEMVRDVALTVSGLISNGERTHQ